MQDRENIEPNDNDNDENEVEFEYSQPLYTTVTRAKNHQEKDGQMKVKLNSKIMHY